MVRPMWKTHYGDYDHLARVKEWAASGGEVRTSGETCAPDSGGRKGPPDRSRRSRAVVFVCANAGSGKTHVLVQRVINLLLRGVAPGKSSASH